MKEWGVEDNSVVSHRLKTMGSFTRTDDRGRTENIPRSGRRRVFNRFKEVIRAKDDRSFEKDPEGVGCQLATGQIFTAQQAKENGLIDRIGFLDKAVDRAVELTGLSEDDVHVVKYKPEPTLADALFGADANVRTPAAEVQALFDSVTPRAYYLFTWLPAAVGTER